MLNSSLLPKLLAKEDLTVKHGNYNTAWFDVKNRVLGLPLWKEMHKDVYDLFIGHEVGHALETPVDGWHASEKKLKGCPRSYINVIEDARIERKIQSRYPGLIGSFNRGYKQLLDRDFFGPLDNVEWDSVKLIDKINLKTKLGTKLDVPFTDEERVFLDRSLTTSTFEDVLDLVRDILAWTKENQPELLDNTTPNKDDNNGDSSDYEESHTPESVGDEPESDEDDSQSTNSQDTDSAQGEDESDDESEETESGNDLQSDTTAEDDESGDEGDAVKSDQPIHDEDESLTDVNFRKNESSLLESDESGVQTHFVGDVSKKLIDTVVIEYPKLKESRLKLVKEYGSYDTHTDADFKHYIKGIKKNIQVAVKEFEMRKAAYRYSKAQTSKTGTINVDKLWSYKTNEDIFHTATKLADAKNHGMMLLVDMSGSMCSSMPKVMDQVMHLIMFCKAVNIPFDIYGFTSTNPDLSYSDCDYSQLNLTFDPDQLSMPHICSSSFNKADFMDSIEHIYKRTLVHGYANHILPRYEAYGSTPLNQALIVSHHLIKKFKQKNNIEKLNFITFTDGDANYINRVRDTHAVTDGGKIADVELYGDSILQIDGSRLKTNLRNSRTTTTDLLGNLKKKYGTNNIGFFMADAARDWKGRLRVISNSLNGRGESYDTHAAYISQANKEYNKNKCVHAQNVLGYNEYYLVKGGYNLKTEDDEFSVNKDASNANIRSAFKKYAKSKKQNKVLLTKFATAVA